MGCKSPFFHLHLLGKYVFDFFQTPNLSKSKQRRGRKGNATNHNLTQDDTDETPHKRVIDQLLAQKTPFWCERKLGKMGNFSMAILVYCMGIWILKNTPKILRFWTYPAHHIHIGGNPSMDWRRRRPIGFWRVAHWWIFLDPSGAFLWVQKLWWVSRFSAGSKAMRILEW